MIKYLNPVLFPWVERWTVSGPEQVSFWSLFWLPGNCFSQTTVQHISYCKKGNVISTLTKTDTTCGEALVAWSHGGRS